MKHTAIYLRVSGNGQKFDSQREDIDKWVERHHPAKVRYYEDKFIGTTMDRPAM